MVILNSVVLESDPEKVIGGLSTRTRARMEGYYVRSGSSMSLEITFGLVQ